MENIIQAYVIDSENNMNKKELKYIMINMDKELVIQIHLLQDKFVEIKKESLIKTVNYVVDNLNELVKTTSLNSTAQMGEDRYYFIMGLNNKIDNYRISYNRTEYMDKNLICNIFMID